MAFVLDEEGNIIAFNDPEKKYTAKFEFNQTSG